MTYQELLKLKLVLMKIKNKDAHVDEVIAYVNKDIALREQQQKAYVNQAEYDHSPW